jgi:hypothetical protein
VVARWVAVSTHDSAMASVNGTLATVCPSSASGFQQQRRARRSTCNGPNLKGEHAGKCDFNAHGQNGDQAIEAQLRSTQQQRGENAIAGHRNDKGTCRGNTD